MQEQEKTTTEAIEQCNWAKVVTEVNQREQLIKVLDLVAVVPYRAIYATLTAHSRKQDINIMLGAHTWDHYHFVHVWIAAWGI